MNKQIVASMKRYNVQAPTSYKDALWSVIKICEESSDYSRRSQCMHNLSMVALGLTEGQRIERHERTLQRSEKYKENRSMIGKSRARQELREQQMEDCV